MLEWLSTGANARSYLSGNKSVACKAIAAYLEEQNVSAARRTWNAVKNRLSALFKKYYIALRAKGQTGWGTAGKNTIKRMQSVIYFLFLIKTYYSTAVSSETLGQMCPYFEQLDAIASDKPNAQPLYITQSHGKRGRRSKSADDSLKMSQLRISDEGGEDDDYENEEEEEEEEGEEEEAASKAKKPNVASKKGASESENLSAAENPFKADYKRSRGNKTLGFGDSLYYSNELKFTLQEKRFEQQERERQSDRDERAKERKEDARRWDEKFKWEQEEAKRRHELQMEELKVQSLKLELELEAMKKNRGK